MCSHTFVMIMHNHLTAQALQHLNHHKVLIESTATSIRGNINQLWFYSLHLMPYLLQKLEEIKEFPHPHLPDVLQVLCSSQVDVMTVKLPIYQLAIVDILPHHSSTMHRRRHVHDKKYLWFHGALFIYRTDLYINSTWILKSKDLNRFIIQVLFREFITPCIT